MKPFMNAFQRGVVLAALANIGLAIDSAPGHAFYRVRMRINANATVTPPTTSTSFMDGGYYFFDTTITDYNTPATNTNAETSWGPSPSASIYSTLNISTCDDPRDISSCAIAVLPVGSGAWNNSPAVSSGQQFVIEPQTATWPAAAKPSYSMSFGAPSGSGLSFNINGNTKPMTNLILGSYFGLTPVAPVTAVDWYPAGVNGTSTLTAKNIIDNLGLTLGASKTFTLPTGQNTNNMAMTFLGESSSIIFNINSIKFTAAPGPLPIAASLVAFGYSRKLRNRIQGSTSAQN
jgi:hypothetical protein